MLNFGSSRSGGGGGTLLPGRIGSGLAMAAGVGGMAVVALMIGRISLVQGLHDVLLQFAVTLALVLAAVMLHAAKPAWLVPYIIAAWAFCPEIRRLLDWSFGQFSYTPLLSLAPLCVTLVVLLTVVPHFKTIDPWVKRLFAVYCCVMAYGLLMGFLRSGLSAMYELVNYMAPILMLLYVNAAMNAGKMDGSVRDNWLRWIGLVTVLAGVYGIVQYFVMPPWDAFWMVGSEMGSIGLPEPLEVRVFSTLNSPGVTGIFLAFGLAVMALSPKWRAFGPAGMLVAAFCLLLTLVRSGWIAFVVILAVWFFRAESKNRVRALLALGVLVAAYLFVLPKLPGAESINGRLETLGALQEDHSYKERLSFATELVPQIRSNPFGAGLGSTGLGTKLGQGDAAASFDNGFLNLFYTFGVAGGLAMIALVVSPLPGLLRIRGSGRAYASLAAAMVAATLFLLLGQNVLSGVHGVLLWLTVGLAFLPEREPGSRPERR